MKPNILLLVIDSLRGDRCYGKNKTSKTPTMDKLIKKGVYFSQTFCSSSTTGSSTGSVFTALFPFKTGMGGKTYRKLDSKNILYTDILKEQGYHPFALLPSNEIVTMGLPFGFEKNYETYPYHVHLFDGLGKQIIKKISSKVMQEPWFLYIHLLDLHSPISPPKKFSTKEFGISKYEKMVSAIDYWLDKIFQKIDFEKTLFILTADHGEYIPVIKIGDDIIDFETGSTQKSLWKLGAKLPPSIFQHAAKLNRLLQTKSRKSKFSKLKMNLTPYQKRILLTSRIDLHNRVYDELLHIPLIFAGFRVPAKGVIDGLVRNVDIFPTICDILGLKGPKIPLHGRSLLPLINNQELEELPLYVESPPSLEKSSEHVTGVRTTQYKYFRNTKNPQENITLFDLENDPHEEKNIAKTNPQIIEEMEQILMTLLSDSESTSTQNDVDDKETKKIEKELRKMGYI